MLQQAQEPPKSTIEIIQQFDQSAQLLRTDLDTSKILALQMMFNEIEHVLPQIQNILASQQELIARVSTLEQQIKEKEEQKKLKREYKLQERSRRILSDHVQPIPQLIGKNYRKDHEKNVNRYQSTISFKLVATSLVTTLVWLLSIYIHHK